MFIDRGSAVNARWNGHPFVARAGADQRNSKVPTVE